MTAPLTRKSETGFTLLEALIAIVIFSLGILALVGLQAASIKQSTASKYRANAGFLADQLIGQMWVSNRAHSDLKANFETGKSGYNAWLSSVTSTLPGAADNAPTVTVEAVSGGSYTGGPAATTGSKVTIKLFWKAPSEPASDPAHSYTIVTQIKS